MEEGVRLVDDLRACLFDFDGTLVVQVIDFDRMRALTLDVVAHHGLAREAYAGMYVLEMIERACADLGGAGDATASALAFAADAQQAVLQCELEGATSSVALPGVVETLARLQARGIGVGIVTRNCREAVEQVLARTRIPHDVLLTRDDVPHVKPDPRHLLAALAHLGAAPQNAIMCGDHPMDVIAGRRAGMATVGVLPAGCPPTHFAEVAPDLVLGGVGELGSVLGLVAHGSNGEETRLG
jgi:phosphoglycolate phosphatase